MKERKKGGTKNILLEDREISQQAAKKASFLLLLLDPALRAGV